jgi:hypothetical protein
MTFDKVDTMIITSCVDQCHVNRCQRSTIVLLNDLIGSYKYIVQPFKANVIRISPIYIRVLDSYDTLIVNLSSKIVWWS